MARRRKDEKPGCIAIGLTAALVAIVLGFLVTSVTGEGELGTTTFWVVFVGYLVLSYAGRWLGSSTPPRSRGTRARPAVPRDVQAAVYARDQGMCRHCGATEDLQFDHIVPFSRGGSSTEA